MLGQESAKNFEKKWPGDFVNSSLTQENPNLWPFDQYVTGKSELIRFSLEKGLALGLD
jgi:hypothetical protein